MTSKSKAPALSLPEPVAQEAVEDPRLTLVTCTCHDEASKRLCLKQYRCTVLEAYSAHPSPSPEQGEDGTPVAQEQPDFTYYECPECGFDVIHRSDYEPRSTACPLCAGDSGHDVGMTSRPARTTDRPEGKDARDTLTKAEGGRNG